MADTRYLLTRTEVISESTGDYFLTVTETYSDKSVYTYKTFVGSSSDLAVYFQGKIKERAAKFSRAGLAYQEALGDISEVLTWGSDVDTATTGTDPLQQLNLEYETDLETSGWQIDAGSALSLVFTVDGNGDLTYTISGGSSYTGYFWDFVIRLDDYPSASDVSYFFKKADGDYISADGTVTITVP